VLELVQRELRHARARPRQRVDHGDGLRGSHVDRRRSAGTKRALGKTRGAQCSGMKTRKTGAMGAKC
jgi:hypothetical protein